MCHHGGGSMGACACVVNRWVHNEGSTGQMRLRALRSARPTRWPAVAVGTSSSITCRDFAVPPPSAGRSRGRRAAERSPPDVSMATGQCRTLKCWSTGMTRGCRRLLRFFANRPSARRAFPGEAVLLLKDHATRPACWKRPLTVFVNPSAVSRTDRKASHEACTGEATRASPSRRQRLAPR